MSNQSEAVADFVSSLSDLRTTNKANISMLTILADDDKRFAPEITKVIENRMREAPPPEKLPVLYLIDSIIKNLPDTQYRELFAENIVNNFVNVFSQVDEKTRGAMYKVRQTWSDIFSAKKLFVLDVKVNKLDSKWPIMPLPPDENAARLQQLTKPPPITTVPPKPMPTATGPAPSAEVSVDATAAAREEELRKVRKMHSEMQLEGQKQQNEDKKTDNVQKESNILAKQISLFLEQVKTIALPEAAQKLILETLDSTLKSAETMQGASSSSTAPTLRDPRKRGQADSVDRKEDSGFGQMVQNLREAERCLKGSENGEMESSNGRAKHELLAPSDGTTMSPGGTRRLSKRPLEPRDTSVPASKAAKGGAEDDGMEACKEETNESSDAEFYAAVDDFKQISQDQLFPRKSALKKAGPPVIEASQPLEPTQPLHPPSSATSLSVEASRPSMNENDQMRLLDEAEKQLHSGQLTAAQHGDLVDKLTQLYDIQRKINDKREKATPDVSKSIIDSAELNAPVRGKTSTAVSAPPAPLHSGPLLPTPTPNVEPPPLQPAAFPPTAHVVLNGEPIEIAIGGPPRTVIIGGKRRAIRINAQSRQVLLDGRPVYKLNSPLRNVMVDNTQLMIFYHGEMQSIWINSVEYRLRVDAPPQTIIVDGHSIEIVIDTGAGEILVNGERACSIANLPCDVSLPPSGIRYRLSYHAPVRQIQIDNQACEIKLDMACPAVLINGELRGIRFDGPPRTVLIDDKAFEIHTDRPVQVQITREDPPINIALGAPAQELIIGDHRYNIGFGTGPVYLMVNNRKVKVELPGHTPEVKMLGLIDQNTGQLIEPFPPMPLPPMPMFGQPHFMPPMPPPMPPGPGMFPGMFAPSQMAANQAHHSGSYAQPMAPVEPIHSMPPPPPNIPPPAMPVAGPVDVNDLISKLMNKGLLPLAPASAPQQQQQVIPKTDVKETPDLTEFNMDMLKQKYPCEITRLYAGVQCGSCGCRFSSPESTRYRLHLDWHFRVNKREREAVRVLRHRAWFLPVMDWIGLEQSAEPDQSLGVNESSMMINVSGEPAEGSGRNSGQRGFAEVPTGDSAPSDGVADRPTNLFSNPNSDDRVQENVHVISCPAASDTKKDVCVVCGEGFETFWNEDLDEWHLKDAVCVAGKTYHTVCFEDAARAGSVASTPSSPNFPPNTPLIGNSNSHNKTDPENSAICSTPPPPGAMTCTTHQACDVKLEPTAVKMEVSSVENDLQP